MSTSLFSSAFKAEPYWWDRTARPEPREQAMPPAVDVAIVGSGYTGLNAALVLARAGRRTLVLEAEVLGWGCSTRNGGQVSTSIKPSFEALSARHGPECAMAVLREGPAALQWIKDFVERERIDCDLTACGRFHAAHSPAQYELLARTIANEPRGLETGGHLVPRAEQHSEIGTDVYHGGVVYPRHASLDPARYHAGLLMRATEAGAAVVGLCPATGLRREGNGFEVETPRGLVRARNVIVATNGYTGRLTPWFRRRVIPIGSYMIATEPLAPELMERLMPRNRVVSDTRKVVYYYRASPDRRRILFGGRVSLNETDPRRSGPKLHADLVRIFPDLAETRITHSWAGTVAYTFDTLAHIGERDGIHYAMGYCGSGVSMASYFGMRLGHRVLGDAEGKTGFDGLTFQTRPFYTGTPWFLAPSVAYYRWRDNRGLWSPA